MTGTIAIIDYGSGNLRSAAKAFERVVSEQALPYQVVVTNSAAVIARAARVVLPGQGAFGDCMKGLVAQGNALAGLQEAVLQHKTPFFGICVGMQLMARKGYEHGEHDGLGWLDGEVKKIVPADPTLKIPHMGWNTLTLLQQNHPALQHINSHDHFYFVHSFMMELNERENVLATSHYGSGVTAIAGRDNMIGTQFHAEKSQDAGLRLIRGFLDWRP